MTHAIDPATRVAITDLHARYVAIVDAGDFANWAALFVEDGHYRIVARENHDRGLPLSIMDLCSRGALLDRVYGVESTLFHAPYYQRHIVGPAIVAPHPHGGYATEANYLVIRTKRDSPSEVFNAGRYLDRVVETPDGLRFAERVCVFDSEWIPNSIIYPL